MSIFKGFIPLGSLDLFVGLGCALCWVTITKYIEHSPSLSVFSRTIEHAGPNIIRHGINMIPFFIGFAMLGLAVFWPTFRFRAPNIAFFSLFCIMLGDEISNTFQEVMQFDMMFGALFMFAWVFFSMSVMMNLFMIIVGDSFEVVQETHKYDWVTKDKNELIDKEFDDSSSSSSSDDDHHHHHHHHNPDKVPLKKKIRSVQALKTIIDEDYDNYIKNNAVSINNKYSTVVKQNQNEDYDLSFEEKRSDDGSTEKQMDDDPFFKESIESPQEKKIKNREDPSEATE